MYGMVLTLERRDQQQPSNGDCGCLHWHMLDTGYHQHSSMPQPLRALCMQYIRATHRVLGKPKFSQADCYFDVNIYLRRIVRPPLMCVRRSSKLATSDMRVVTLITPGVSDRSTCSRLAVGGGGVTMATLAGHLPTLRLISVCPMTLCWALMSHALPYNPTRRPHQPLVRDSRPVNNATEDWVSPTKSHF